MICPKCGKETEPKYTKKYIYEYCEDCILIIGIRSNPYGVTSALDMIDEKLMNDPFFRMGMMFMGWGLG